MGSRQESILVCDNCEKEMSDRGETWVGGHPHIGWYHLTVRRGMRFRSSRERKTEWDFCSKECLNQYVSANKIA